MQEFSPYGPSHLVVMALLVAGGLVLVVWGRGHRDPTTVARDCRILAVAIVVFMVPLQAVAVVRSGYDLQRSLPFQLCDVAALLAPYALWSRRHWAVSLTYYWGLTLTTQAVITPDLSRDFPDPVFILFWAMHLLVVWAAVYLVWALQLTPTWRTYRTAVAITAVWALTVYTFNLAADTNYGYLNAKPHAASALDLLGPWPWYVLNEILVIAALWALLTWPWTRRARTDDAVDRRTGAPSPAPMS